MRDGLWKIFSGLLLLFTPALLDNSWRLGYLILDIVTDLGVIQLVPDGLALLITLIGHTIILLGCKKLHPCSDYFRKAEYLTMGALLTSFLRFAFQGFLYEPLCILYLATVTVQIILVFSGLVQIGKHIGDASVVRKANLTSGLFIGTLWVGDTLPYTPWRLYLAPFGILLAGFALVFSVLLTRRAVHTAETFN
ncbi:MAG: hypothetical protein ACI9QL_003286 [Candidatus Omnitrophota bacterium]|jgi:hypothetical protein